MNTNNYDHNPQGFDKKTLIAVVLSVIVITGVMTLQNFLYPSEPLPPAPQPSSPVSQPQPEAPAIASPAALVEDLFEVEAPSREQTYTLTTDMFTAVFTNRGGELISLQLRQHGDKTGPVEMFTLDQSHPGTFSLALGDVNTTPITALMNVRQPGPGIIEFYRQFPGWAADGDLVPFTLRKRYEFVDGEYMFKLSISMESTRPEALRIGEGNFAYTLQLGPQIGPEYLHLPKRADWRKIITYENNKRRVINTKNQVVESDSRLSWAAITGKYFALIAIPDTTPYITTFVNDDVGGYPGESSIAFSRPQATASAHTDIFYIYAGPKNNRELARYDLAQRNAFGRSGDQLEAAMEGRGILSWLETLLKWGLNFFYALVKNYGVAIILLTLLVRVLMFPLTIKGSKATAKMQEMQPLINELREKYKNNPQRLNKEMAEFYRENGSPLAGCLPNLLQLPIFIAMYGLFNNHFDLRGASFIPGWINDLSLPEAIVSFEPINLVIWELSAIRLLPIIYVISQLFFGKFMQQPATGPGQSQAQMKMMMYGMPIFLFFILYNMPSGLLVYWIASNVLSIGQQLVIKRMMHKHHDEVIQEGKTSLKLVTNSKNGKGGGKIKR